MAFVNDAIRTANPFWHQSSFGCHGYPSRKDGQSLRDSLFHLPDDTPRTTSQSLAFLWTATIVLPQREYTNVKYAHFIPLLVYPKDERPAYCNCLLHLMRCPKGYKLTHHMPVCCYESQLHRQFRSSNCQRRCMSYACIHSSKKDCIRLLYFT
jgi:hypothetical protein